MVRVGSVSATDVLLVRPAVVPPRALRRRAEPCTHRPVVCGPSDRRFKQFHGLRGTAGRVRGWSRAAGGGPGSVSSPLDHPPTRRGRCGPLVAYARRPCSPRSPSCPNRRCSSPSWPGVPRWRPRPCARPATRPSARFPVRPGTGSWSAPTRAGDGPSPPVPAGRSPVTAATCRSRWPGRGTPTRARSCRCRCWSPRGRPVTGPRGCVASWSPRTAGPRRASRSAPSWPRPRTTPACSSSATGRPGTPRPPPAGFDERAEAFDAVVAAALDDAGPGRARPPRPAARRRAARRRACPVAGARRGRARRAANGRPRVRHTSVPYGVAYHVAAWTRR